jgi:DNA-binding transcriptional regulator YiaG
VQHRQYAEFARILAGMDWSQSEFARRVGVDAVTVRRWKQHDRVPLWAIRYGELRLAVMDLGRG